MSTIKNICEKSWNSRSEAVQALLDANSPEAFFAIKDSGKFMDACWSAERVSSDVFTALQSVSDTEEVSYEELKDNAQYGKYQYNCLENPQCSVTSEEIVVSWQTASYIEDVFENIVSNWIEKKPRTLYLAVEAKDSPEYDITYQDRPYYWINEEETMTRQVRQFKFYKLTNFRAPFHEVDPDSYSITDHALSRMQDLFGFPDWVRGSNVNYLQRRVTKLRDDHHVPLKYMRSRPTSRLSKYEKLVVLAKSLAS